jgi:WD40 repeat protein
VCALAVDPTGRLFFSCSTDLSVKLWNAERGIELDTHVPSAFLASSLSTYACPPPSLLAYAPEAQGDGSAETWRC